MAVLGYLPKLKRGLGLAFGANVFHRKISYLILHQLTKFKCQTLFSSQDTKQNMLLSPYLNN